MDFVGVDPEYMREESKAWDGKRAAEVRNGEAERGWGAWFDDLYGRGVVLE